MSQQILSEWKFFSLDLSQLQEIPGDQQDLLEMHQLQKKLCNSFPDRTAISTGTCQDNPVATTTCSSSQSYGGKPELYEFDGSCLL